MKFTPDSMYANLNEMNLGNMLKIAGFTLKTGSKHGNIISNYL